MKLYSEISGMATKLLNSIIAADPNVINDKKISDVIIRDLYKQCNKLVMAISNLPEPAMEVEDSIKMTNCKHEWISSVVHKGVKYCSKCGEFTI